LKTYSFNFMKDFGLNTARAILVTGSNGQLGKTIEELYSKDMRYDFTFVSKEQLDISNEEEVKFFFKNNKFDYCINCAAYTNVEQAEKTPEIAYRVNAEGVKNLAEVCRQNNTILIHISTDYVFDGEKQEPYTIKDTPNPINEYGKSKLLGEKHIQEILKRHFIIRTSWLYSKKHGENFYKKIVEKAQIEKELFITDQQKGCPTDTVSLAQYILELIKLRNVNYGIYHYCDKQVMTWYEFAKLILANSGIINQMTLIPRAYDSSVRRPRYSVLSFE
jgi:dTDP-4-dehydrorhamnose reductase